MKNNFLRSTKMTFQTFLFTKWLEFMLGDQAATQCKCHFDKPPYFEKLEPPRAEEISKYHMYRPTNLSNSEIVVLKLHGLLYNP